MLEAKLWFAEQKIQRTLKALEKNGFKTIYAPTRKEAREKALKLIPQEAKVGIGGSITIHEIGLVEELLRRGNKVFQTWKKTAPDEDLAIRRAQLTCDVFVSSSNAVTEDGKLVNADGTGNRVAAMTFGPQKVIVIAGLNKIVKNVQEGIERIRSVAAPMNARRLGRTTPCVVDACNLEACELPSRQCNVITILEKRPRMTDVTVMLVSEELGF